ncbi:unnamed protein product [Ixodes hexagonus]
MKFAGLAVLLGCAALLGLAAAGIDGKRKVLKDFVDTSDLQLKQLKELVKVADPALRKEIRENVGEEVLHKYAPEEEPRTRARGGAQVLKDYLVSTEKQYAQLRQLLKTADPALRKEIKDTVQAKLGHFRALLERVGK